MDFEALEAMDGVRFTWQYWLASKQAQSKLAVPPATLVTIAKDIPNMPVLPYAPSQCRHCKGILNCHASVDFNSKVWTCPFCSTKQALPHQYQGITPDMVPAELHQGMNVVEYQLPGAVNAPLCLFILDLCMSAEDMEQMKLSVEQAIALLPDNTLVGIITFGSMLYVHEMLAAELPRCVMCRGSKETTKHDLIQVLALGHARAAALAGAAAAPGLLPPSAYFLPLSECSFAVESVLESMTPELPLPVRPRELERMLALYIRGEG